MPNPMIDRIASVLSRALPNEAFATTTPEDCARAVLAAMREPTEAMEVAGFHQVDPTNQHPDDVMQNVWTAMIDAAMAEEG